jgi:acylphosphatase
VNEGTRCVRARVTGRVQGVGFRMATRSRARQLGLRGYVANCPKGEVEVLASGPEDAVRALIEWLAEGPPAARVADVSVEESNSVIEATGQFEIR